MGKVQFGRIEADAYRALGGVDKGAVYARHIVLGHGTRYVPAWTERNCRGRNRRPRILSGRQRLAALPRPLGGSLASGMGKLNGELGAADAPAMGNDPLQRRLARVGIKAEAAMRDPAGALNIG